MFPEVQTFTCSDPQKTPKGTNFRKHFFANNPKPRGKPFHQTCLALQDAGVTDRRQLEFTTLRAVCRLTQVPKGRGAKRGEVRGAAQECGPRKSQQTPCACSRGACTPPSAAVAVGTLACALTYLVLSRRYMDLYNNTITSLAGVTFPASLS